MNTFFYCSINRFVRRIFLIPSIALFCYSNLAQAATAPAAAECEEQKIQIELLKNRIKLLESIKTPTGKSKKAIANRWDSLQVDLTKDDIKLILGKPGRVDKWKTGEAWYYPNHKGGEVDFDANGKVTGWLKP